MISTFIKHIALLLILAMFIGSCRSSSEERILKLAHGLNTEHPVHLGMLEMSRILEEKSSGKMRLEIYPNQQLGTERQCLELLQIGALDITKVSSAVMENFSPDMRVLGLPYLFRDRAHCHQVLDGPIGKNLLLSSEKYLLRGLGYYEAGARSFYTKEKPVEKASDLKGMKIRVMQSPNAIKTVRSMGGSATPMSSGELYTALQQGIVDGAENNPPTFYTSRHYEVCPYYSLDEHSVLPDILVIGTSTWNRLNEQQQQWLQYAMDKSVQYQRKLWLEKEKEVLVKLKEAGVTIIKPDKKTFHESVKSIYNSYSDEKIIADLIQEIQNMK